MQDSLYLALGLFLTVILVLIILLMQKFFTSSRQLRGANQALQREIEERRNAEATLRHYEKLAIMGVFASELAHEVGTPLNIISGRAELLMNRLGDQHVAHADLKVIMEQIDRVSRIIQNILDFAKRKKLALVPCDINALIDKTLNFFNLQLRAKGITTQFQAGKKLPPIACDVDQIEQVLINLLANSMQAMPRGGKIKIQTFEKQGEKGQPHLCVSVQDTGEGIAPEHLERIFDPFFSARENGEGSGLGLAVCKQIMANHNAEIIVKSAKNEGTEFTLQFQTSLNHP